jgi:outer membrane lipoprotein-sorting protein
MRVSRLIALSLTFAFCAFSTVSAAPQSAKDLLRAAMQAPAKTSYVGQVQILRFGSQKSEASIFRIEHRAPDLTRRWYLAPQDLYGDSIISHGETTYSIDIKRDRVVVTQDDAIDDQVAEDDNFGLLNANYRVDEGPRETLFGRPVRTLVLTNRYTGVATMRVRLDAQTFLVLDRLQYAPNGALVSQMRFENLRYTNDIPQAIFSVPNSMTHVDGPRRGMPSYDLQRLIKTAGFDARGPKYLPEGFLPIAGNVVDMKGVRSLHLLYSDGIRTASLFENAKGATVDMSGFKALDTKVEGHDARYVEDGPTTLLAWSEAGLHFTLVGELTRNELEKIAASIVQ